MQIPGFHCTMWQSEQPDPGRIRDAAEPSLHGPYLKTSDQNGA